MRARTAIELKTWEKELTDAEHPRVVWYWDVSVDKAKSGQTQGPPSHQMVNIGGIRLPVGDVYPTEQEVIDSRK